MRYLTDEELKAISDVHGDDDIASICEDLLGSRFRHGEQFLPHDGRVCSCKPGPRRKHRYTRVRRNPTPIDKSRRKEAIKLLTELTGAAIGAGIGLLVYVCTKTKPGGEL